MQCLIVEKTEQDEQEQLVSVEIVEQQDRDAAAYADAMYLDEFQPDRWFYRTPLIIAGVAIASLLITARMLTPSDQKMGTHQQLGLPECGFITMFGIPCPSCGMTTSWSHLTRGHVVSAIDANPGGTLLGISAAFFAPWFVLCGIFGKWVFRINLKILLTVVVAIFVVTLGNWIYKVFLF